MNKTDHKLDENLGLVRAKVPTAKPKVKVQTLPRPTQNVGLVTRHAITPKKATTLKNFGPDAPVVFAAMGESITYGMMNMLDRHYTPPQQPELTERMLATRLGRGLWSWTDIDQPDQSNLKAVAMRPSSALPVDLREVSPRLALDLLKTSGSQLLTGHRASWSPDKALGLAGYGVHQDSALPPFFRLGPVPESERTGYSARQNAILDMAGDVLPFSTAIVQRTLFHFDFGQSLREAKQQLCEDAVSVSNAVGRPLDIEDVLPEYEKVVDNLLRHKWQLAIHPLPEVGEELDPFDILQRLVVQKFGSARDGQYFFTADHLLQLSYATGISPASFVRYAVSDFERRGMTYIKPETIEELADQVELNARAAALVTELRGLTFRLDLATTSQNDNHALIIKELAGSSSWEQAFPEWGLGRSYTLKRLNRDE